MGLPESRSAPDDALRVGYVARVHGLQGALEVRLDWAGSRALYECSEVILESPEGEREGFEVVSARPAPKGVLVFLRGISDRTAAEGRRGHSVWVSRAALPELAPGEYYLSDLIGASVSVRDEGTIGKVVAVQTYPSVDAIVVEGADGKRWEQPLLDEWIERIDLGGRVVWLESEDGMIEVPKGASRERGPGTAREG